ncbi:MAG: ribonuclease HII [Prochlorothrix sp.]|nr:ribonuclease HII [Prochlorothrix sp.]
MGKTSRTGTPPQGQLPLPHRPPAPAPSLDETGVEVAGVDEVGRGALCGPVVAAAVMLDRAAVSQLQALGLTDSKQLSARQRQGLAGVIRSLALDCQLGLASVAEIDRLNILQASLLAMHRAIAKLQPSPHLCRIDGNRSVPHLVIPQETWVQGDRRCPAIAAASIVAKVWRDALMERLDRRYPGYGMAQHKGYGTAQHRSALLSLGPSPCHRRSFAPCQAQQITLL